jgi:hypothetical protein
MQASGVAPLDTVKTADKTAGDNQSGLLPALQKLRDRINHIEVQHPDLRTGLTEVCDEAIIRLQPSPPDRPPEITGVKPNPFVRAIDGMGGYMVRGLERAGDGIIFAIDNLLNLGRRSGKAKDGQSQH